jgi:hypothetical protein
VTATENGERADDGGALLPAGAKTLRRSVMAAKVAGRAV